MKLLMEILEAILSLFFRGKRQKVMTPSPFYKELPPPEEVLPRHSLGIDKDGNEMFITEDISEEDLAHAREQFRIDNIDKKIVCNDVEIPIDWEDTILWTEPGALMCKSSQYKTVSDNRMPSIDKVVVHWDGCLNSAQCAKVLRQRGLSAHFCIDNDGTIHQLMDTNHVAWHARGVNSKSIGIEISNAVFKEYAHKYDPPRPMVPKSTLHGKPFPEHMGFYDVQVEALQELLRSLCSFYNVPLEYPNQNGELIRNVIKTSTFKGVICHYHITENKVDPACLDLAKLIEEIKDEI